MARSKYIYLVYEKYTGRVLSAHTVKRDAFDWCGRSCFFKEDVYIMRMRDGLAEPGEKSETEIEWPTNS